jgi:hypothetical protein
MRYVTVFCNGRHIVIDTILYKILGVFDTQSEADAKVVSLNSDPEVIDSERIWVTAKVSRWFTEEDLLNAGFEPFAASFGQIFFRKLIVEV